MSWIFVCDRCQKPSIIDGIPRRNGEHSGEITIHYHSKTSPEDDKNPDNQKLELCYECWENHGHWIAGLDTVPPAYTCPPVTCP